MMLKTLPLAATAALLAGCATVPQASSDQWAAFGEATSAGRVTVRPETLIEDSRCPMNARCVWAGRVVIDSTVWVDKQKYPARLTLGEPFRIAGGELVLDSVEPSRTTQQGDIPPAEYRFHFDFR
jgi:hypothetical protein